MGLTPLGSAFNSLVEDKARLMTLVGGVTALAVGQSTRVGLEPSAPLSLPLKVCTAQEQAREYWGEPWKLDLGSLHS